MFLATCWRVQKLSAVKQTLSGGFGDSPSRHPPDLNFRSLLYVTVWLLLSGHVKPFRLCAYAWPSGAESQYFDMRQANVLNVLGELERREKKGGEWADGELDGELGSDIVCG